MKFQLSTSVAVAAVLALAACNPNTGNSSPTPEGPGQSSAANAVQDAAAGPVGQASAATLGSVSTDSFVPNAARGDMYEIQSSQLAGERTQNAEIRRLARMIVTDHQTSTRNLQQAVRTGNVNTEIPTTLDERRQGLIDNLRAAQGAEFDRVWVSQQITAHQEALTLHEGFRDRGDNDALKAFAGQTAPVVARHLEELRRIEGTMSGGAGSGSGASGASGSHSGSGEH